MVIVDSSIWIEAARREGSLEAKVGLEGLLDEFEALVCPPVKLEVLGGSRKQDRAVWLHYFSVLPYKPMEDRYYDAAVQNAWILRDAGQSIPWNDILIATLAKEWDCRIYVQDKHFEAAAPILHLRLYKPDYGGKYRPED